ncbi:MAG: hypothetical protein AAF416_16295 [Pseudomonadota bacterium]
MQPRRRALIAAFAASPMALLGGCSLFGDDEEEVAEAQAVLERRREPVENVGRVEVGRTRNGFAVSAYGVAPTTGFSQPILSLRRDGSLALDGFLEFDFLALAPDPGLAMPRGQIAARRIRADRVLKPDELQGARGLRIFALRNASSFEF